MRRILILLVLVVAINGDETTGGSGKTRTKTVSTLLNAKWTSTPTELEMSEFLNDEDPAYFWSFLEALHSKSAVLKGRPNFSPHVQIKFFNQIHT